MYGLRTERVKRERGVIAAKRTRAYRLTTLLTVV